MASHRGLARNADLAQILPIVGGSANCQMLHLPSGITVSAGTTVNGWTDASGNGRNLTVLTAAPTKSTIIPGVPAVLYPGVNQSLVAPVTWATYLPGNVHWLLEVWQPLAAGGTNGAGLFYQNKGPGPSDPNQFVNIAQFQTVAGVDSDQSEVWINGATPKDTSANTTVPGSTTRSIHLYENWIDSGAVMHTRVANGAGAKTSTVAGVTAYGLKTGTPVFGRTGAASPYLNCLQAFVMLASISPTAFQQAFARKILGRFFGVEW